MTNCAETAHTPHEQQLVDVAAILAAGILRLRERPAQFSVMSRTNEADFELLRRFRTFLKALNLYSEIKRRRAEESSVGIKEGELPVSYRHRAGFSLISVHMGNCLPRIHLVFARTRH